MEYPKIETLYDRDEKTFKVKEDQVRLPEFSNVKNWWVTEKIDGTNVRITYYVGGHVTIDGRTENAQMPTFLMNYLQQTFTLEKFQQAFPDLKDHETVILFGEGYGARIQKGGNYRPKDVSFRLIDVRVEDWWLEPLDILDVADKLGISTVPEIGIMTLEEAVAFLKSKPTSIVAKGEGGNPQYPMEGIVARSHPLMLRRNGERIIWKLKRKDYP
jgi:ATP-dependent RNA circularization protein (DNA/RNA ligase family)